MGGFVKTVARVAAAGYTFGGSEAAIAGYNALSGDDLSDEEKAAMIAKRAAAQRLSEQQARNKALNKQKLANQKASQGSTIELGGETEAEFAKNKKINGPSIKPSSSLGLTKPKSTGLQT